jgi:hypothetical protein
MTDREKLIEAMARAMAEPLGARVPYDALPIDASQPKLADGSGLSQELLIDGATAALSAIEAMGATVVPVEVDDETAEGIWRAAYDEWAEFGAADKDAGHAAHRASIAASPYAKEPSDG